MSETKNIAASVRQRLHNVADKSGENFNLLLIRFANERILYRLGISKFRDDFLLKGASLFSIWLNDQHRPTRDIDLLGLGSNEVGELEKMFLAICEIGVNDGLKFDLESIKGIEIKEGEEYQGVRISFLAFLEKARINAQIDVGFGDAVTPDAVDVEFPTILEFPAPKLRAYPKETVVAEKFEALVKLGMLNSRMKDFWDLSVMIAEFEFDNEVLAEAISATFARRKTILPGKMPLALSSEFSDDSVKRLQWNAFIMKNKLAEKTLESVIEELSEFFKPIAKSLNEKRHQ